MNHNEAIYSSIALICFTVVLAIYDNVLSLFIVKNDPTITLWVKTISAIGIFAFLFQLLMFLANKMVKNFFSDESKIIGNWFQVFEIYNYDNHNNKEIRHCPVTINFIKNSLEIVATNLKIDTEESSSTWHSNKVSIDGNQVWLLFLGCT